MNNKTHLKTKSKSYRTPSYVFAVILIAVSCGCFFYAGMNLFVELCLYAQVDPEAVWCWIMSFGLALSFVADFSMLLMGIDIFIIKKKGKGLTTLKVLQVITLICSLAAVVCIMYTAFPMNVLILPGVLPVLLITVIFSIGRRVSIKELKKKATLASIEIGAVSVIVPMLFFTGFTMKQYFDMFARDQSFAASADFKNFSVDCFDGTKLDQDYFKEHKLTMVNCWETTCGPCIRELPYLQQEYEQRYGSDFAIIGICSDLYEGGEVSEKVLNDGKTIISESGVKYPVVIPSKDLMYGIINDITAFPTTFFVDSEGNVIKVVMGSKEKEDWDKVIDECLLQVTQGN